MKTLIVDNNIDVPWDLCPDIRRYLDGQITVRRAPQEDLPKNPLGFSHIILSGSKTSCLDVGPWIEKLTRFIHAAVESGIPVFGICYGHQLIARIFGGDKSVRKAEKPEFGWVEIQQKRNHPLLEGLPERFHSFQSHYDEVCQAPKGFIVATSSERCAVQAYYLSDKPVFGVQFHPERNAEEGQSSIDGKKKAVPSDCIFNDRKAKSVFDENVAITIFRNFLAQAGKL